MESNGKAADLKATSLTIRCGKNFLNYLSPAKFSFTYIQLYIYSEIISSYWQKNEHGFN
jgi:hypothetical protein